MNILSIANNCHPKVILHTKIDDVTLLSLQRLLVNRLGRKHPSYCYRQRYYFFHGNLAFAVKLQLTLAVKLQLTRTLVALL